MSSVFTKSRQRWFPTRGNFPLEALDGTLGFTARVTPKIRLDRLYESLHDVEVTSNSSFRKLAGAPAGGLRQGEAGALSRPVGNVARVWARPRGLDIGRYAMRLINV